jgi:hypothetical protein
MVKAKSRPFSKYSPEQAIKDRGYPLGKKIYRTPHPLEFQRRRAKCRMPDA